MSKGAKGQIIELGGEPRINFLPPEIQQRKDARRRRRSLFMLVILVGVLCVIGYVYSAQYAADRQAALEVEQQATANLLAEQSQYAEASQLASKVELTDQAITLVSSTEVFWREYVREIRNALPAGVTAEGWQLRTLGVTEPPLISGGLFPVESVGSISFGVTVNSLPTVSQLLTQLGEVVGVTSVKVSGVTLAEGRYQANVELSFNSDALEKRYAEGWDPSYLEDLNEIPPVEDSESEDGSSESNSEGDDAEAGLGE